MHGLILSTQSLDEVDIIVTTATAIILDALGSLSYYSRVIYSLVFLDLFYRKLILSYSLMSSPEKIMEIPANCRIVTYFLPRK